MTLPIIPLPETMNDGLRNFLAMINHQLENNNVESAKRMLIDLYNDVGLAYDCRESNEIKSESFLPEYDQEEDGDYSAWLVSHNID